jgi:Ca-activated chloride channel family protein
MVGLPEIISASVAVLAVAGEFAHSRRTARLASLAFGPGMRPRRWTKVAPALRVLAITSAAWALTILCVIEPKVFKVREAAANQQRHVVIVLDVSPSMKLDDAGIDGKQRRSKRASELMFSFFKRVPMELVKLTVIATYTGAKPVVVDTRDVAVVRNILDDLPLDHAFDSGKTDLFSGIREAARIAHPWERDSTTILILSDGDSVPPAGMPKLPPSVADVVLVGVGDPRAGKFINGYQSRQQAAAMQQIAVRLHGTYHDGNQHQLPTELLRRMIAVPEPGFFEKLTLREYALFALGAGAFALALLPWLLHFRGASWRPGVRPVFSPSPARVAGSSFTT